MRLSWSLIEVELSLSWVGIDWGWVDVELRSKMDFHRVRVMVQKHFLSLLILQNNIYLLCFLQFLVLFFTQLKGLFLFLGSKWAIFWTGVSFKTVLGSLLKNGKVLFSVPSSIISFVFDLILGPFRAFWCTNGLFWKVQKLFWGLLM